MAYPTVSYVSFLLSNSPVKPEEMDWSELYPEFFAPLTQNKSHDDPKDAKEKQAGTQVEFADIGCGYGGLLGNVLALFLGQGEAWVLLTRQVRVRVNGLFLRRPDSSDISARDSASVSFALEKGGGCLKCILEPGWFCLAPVPP